MRIKELEALFAKEETLDRVLEDVQEDLKLTDYWSGIMKQDITDNPQEVKKALNQLTGVFMNLKVVLAIATTERKNREIKYYTSLKIKLESAGQKFTSASAEKEAEAYVCSYTRIENAIEGYLGATEKGISSLQSLLKTLTEEQKMMPNIKEE